MRRWQRRAIVAGGITGALAVGVAAGAWWWLDHRFEQIPTFEEVYRDADLAPVPALHTPSSTTTSGPEPTTTAPATTAPPTTTTMPPRQRELASGASSFLVFSVGSRGVDAVEGAAAGISASRSNQADGLTDSLMLVVVDPGADSTRVLSIPRDLWLGHRGTKINAVLNRWGPDALADDVTALTGIEIDFRIAVNFAAFSTIADALGGVPVHYPGPTRDPVTGLEFESTGCHLLDGPTALTFVRARYLQVQNAAGEWVYDRSASDFGRIDRQQRFLRALLDANWGAGLIDDVPALMDAARDNLIIDDHMSLTDVLGLARALRGGLDVEFHTYPGAGGQVGAASVVLADRAAAELVLDRVASAGAPLPSSIGSASGGVGGTGDGGAGGAARTDPYAGVPRGFGAYQSCS